MIYLKGEHGTIIAYTEAKARKLEKGGWTRFTPEVKVKEEVKVKKTRKKKVKKDEETDMAFIRPRPGRGRFA